MFGQSAFSSTTTAFGKPATGVTSTNPNSDFEVVSPPDDSISCLEFSPASLAQNYLIAGSWDKSVRCWEVEQTGKTIPKSMQSMTGPILDACWNDDGTKVFMASCDKQVKMWDLASNQTIQVAAHDAPIKTCHWIKAPNYCCLMTGSWDKTLKFWDARSPTPMLQLAMSERVYCADVDYPLAIVGTASRQIHILQLEGKPTELKKIESPLKYQERCVAIFRDKKKQPTGFALGSIEGRVAIHYLNPNNPKENFTFKCHRSNPKTGNFQDIYAVNQIAFHPVHGTLVTIGSDGTFTFWDKDSRTKLKPSEPMDQPITACAFNHTGQIFAYAVGYDWSMGHEFHNTAKKNYIFLRPCFDETKPRN